MQAKLLWKFTLPSSAMLPTPVQVHLFTQSMEEVWVGKVESGDGGREMRREVRVKLANVPIALSSGGCCDKQKERPRSPTSTTILILPKNTPRTGGA